VAVVVVAEELLERFYYSGGNSGGMSRLMMELFVVGVNTSLKSFATLALYVAAFVMLVLV
jgi:hypothetical protein